MPLGVENRDYDFLILPRLHHISGGAREAGLANQDPITHSKGETDRVLATDRREIAVAPDYRRCAVVVPGEACRLEQATAGNVCAAYVVDRLALVFGKAQCLDPPIGAGDVDRLENHTVADDSVDIRLQLRR